MFEYISKAYTNKHGSILRRLKIFEAVARNLGFTRMIL